MLHLPARLAAIAVLCWHVQAATTQWTRVESSHFELYSQSGPDSGRAALLWFEQLRTFFEQIGLKSPATPVRVIGFASAKEYEPFRLRPAADAYFVGTDHRKYIVMATLAPDHFWVAAHEYAHLALDAQDLHLPLWLSEGLAEFFSTVHIGERGCSLGGDLPMRSQTLRRHAWIPLAELADLPANAMLGETRETAGMFYAESWALTQMLILSPEYAPHFRQLLYSQGPQALIDTYGKPLAAINADLRRWVDRGRLSSSIALPGVLNTDISIRSSAISISESVSLLADLEMVIGRLDLAEATYRSLMTGSPKDADIAAALGTIRLREGDRDGARREWKRAIDLGVRDPMLCYRYAVLADEAGLAPAEFRQALERAIALKPDFDDARFKLGLLESNTGDYQAASDDLLKMHTIAPERAYGYWSAVANAFNELGRRDEANSAAEKALAFAKTPAERAHALELGYISQTDFAVQFNHDANGNAQLITTRVPHNTPDHNPFVEPSDHMCRIEGSLREVRCGGSKVTAISVATATGPLILSVPDPSHVLMRNAPAEFVCGPQSPAPVTVDYALSDQPAPAAGILRGMEFRPH